MVLDGKPTPKLVLAMDDKSSTNAAFTEEDLGTANPGFDMEDEGKGHVGEGASNKTEVVAMYSLSLAGKASRTLSVPVGGSGESPSTLGDEGPWWGKRHTMGLLSFLGMVILYMVRVNLSIAIVAMVKKAPQNTSAVGTVLDICPAPANVSHSSVGEGEFDWDEQSQGLLLGAFFWGYMASNFIGGRAAEYLGGHLVFGLAVIVPSLLSLLSPLAAYTSKNLFIALRVLEGLTQGPGYPSMSLLMAKWIPPQERARFGSVIYPGAPVGALVAMSIGGWLCNTSFLGGWPSVFYVFGTVGVLWGIPWFVLVRNRPEEHPSISTDELKYIQSHQDFVENKKAMSIPWWELVKSGPFWAILLMNYGYSYGYFTLLTAMPTYFSNIMHFNMRNNGLISAMPYLSQSVLSLVWGPVADILLAKGVVSREAVRKFSTGFAMYSSAAALICMYWVDCNPLVATIILCIAVGTLGSLHSGHFVSEQDIAPNLAGSLKGISNTLGAVTGILAPTITGAVINGNQTLTAWRTVFTVAWITDIICGTSFVIFGSTKVQSWNEPPTEEDSTHV